MQQKEGHKGEVNNVDKFVSQVDYVFVLEKINGEAIKRQKKGRCDHAAGVTKKSEWFFDVVREEFG